MYICVYIILEYKYKYRYKDKNIIINIKNILIAYIFNKIISNKISLVLRITGYIRTVMSIKEIEVIKVIRCRMVSKKK